MLPRTSGVCYSRACGTHSEIRTALGAQHRAGAGRPVVDRSADPRWSWIVVCDRPGCRQWTGGIAVEGKFAKQLSAVIILVGCLTWNTRAEPQERSLKADTWLADVATEVCKRANGVTKWREYRFRREVSSVIVTRKGAVVEVVKAKDSDACWAEIYKTLFDPEKFAKPPSTLPRLGDLGY